MAVAKLLALAAVVALTVTGVTAAPASARRACTTGHMAWSVGPAGQTLTRASVWLTTEDSPPGCEQVLARALSSGGHTTRSGLVRFTGTTATATVQDGTHLAKAWAEKQPNGDPANRRCKQIYPSVETNFHDCTG